MYLFYIKFVRYSFLFILFVFIRPTLSGQCDPQRDSLILVNLYNATKGPEWVRNNNWLSPSIPFRSWYGVIVNAAGCVSELNLNSNRLEGPMPDNITNLTEIVRLNLNDNRLTIGNTTDSLPNGWSKMQKLEVLNLSSNILGGPVNAELGTLSSLRILNLSLNFFSKKLPSALGNLPNIRQILLNQNEITGSIPASFGQMTTLEELILSQNQLSGSLPDQIGNLSALRVLSITQNQIDGNIPATLGNLTNVQFLYMNENRLSGTIPGTMGNLSNLRELWLNNNLLSGTIPPEIAQASRLRKLLLNNNMLSGNLPDFLTTLTDLNALHVSFNNLTGSIPASIVDLVNLESLLLDNNMLTGTIPQDIGKLQKLTNFQIHHNMISGFLPESLGTIPNLRRIYVHNNLLQGCFPNSYRKFCPLKLNINTNANGYNFLDNNGLLFQGDFDQWCTSNYKVNGDFTSNAPVCEGNTVQFLATAANFNYLWSGPDGFSSTLRNPAVPAFNAIKAGTYSLTVTDFNGCSGTSSQEIRLVSSGEIMVNSPLCEGKTIQFTISPGISYEWSGPDNFSSTAQNPTIPNATKANEGLYRVKIVTADCTIEKEITVQLTTIGDVMQPDVVCEGESIGLSANGGTRYRWTGPDNFSSTMQNPVVQNAGSENAGIYTVTIEDNTGCRSVYEVSADVIPPVKPTLDELGVICPEAEPILLPTQAGDFTGTWSGPGVIIEGNDYYFDPSGKKEFQTLTFLPHPSFACVSDASATIFVYSLLISGNEIRPNTSEDNNNGAFTIQFDGSGNGFDILWEGPLPGSQSSPTPGSLDVNDVPAGLYTITLISDIGCRVTDSLRVRDFYSSVDIPNVVRKSALSKENSVFTVYGTNILSYDLDVYDRWGNKSFSGRDLTANDIQNGWDISSSDLQTGVYVVNITLYLPAGVEKRTESFLLLE